MPRRSVLRRLAAYVLLLWLFGLASGVVNACVIGGEVRHGAPMVSHVGHESHASMAMHEMAMHDMAMDEMAMDAGDQDQTEHSTPPCERLCDAPAVARVADKELGSVLAGFWLAPAPLPTVTLRLLPLATRTAPASEPPWRPGVPLSIAFQHLTL
jgi:hypothetical protein